jgi:hypothetical protein
LFENIINMNKTIYTGLTDVIKVLNGC